MSALASRILDRADALGVPFSVQFDLTYRCNERCIHCYLDHDDHGELATAEVMRVLEEVAAAGTFHLILSGGEIFMRQDLLAIVARARELQFNVKLKSNAVMVTDALARRLRELAVERVQVSVYSHRPEIHDAITKLPGSWRRTLAGIRRLRDAGVRVSIANVLMTANRDDYRQTQALAVELGVGYTLDPTITPMMDGATGVLALRVPGQALREVFEDQSLVQYEPEPETAELRQQALDGVPCSAGHTAAYISPYGDVYPCVQFPFRCGSVREENFASIWRDSPQLHQVRAIRLRDLSSCSGCGNLTSCSRCPGLAYMEGDMRGPSSADCEKSLARTGVLSPNMRRRLGRMETLVQIALPAPAAGAAVAAR